MAARLELLKEQFFDNDGNVLSGGKLYTYIVGTATEKATYTTVTGDVAQANPVILDSDGRIPSDLYGVGAYKIVIKDSSDNTIDTIPTVSGVNSASVTTIGDYSNDFDAAITAIGATETTLYVDAAATMSANVTVPATCAVIVQKGGSIDMGGFSLTFNGPLTMEGGTFTHDATLTISGPFEAGVYDLGFDSTQTVTFESGSVKEIYPQWWEGGIADGSTEAATAINAALDAAHGSTMGGGTVFLLAGSYNVSATLYIKTHTVLQGAGMGATTLKSGDAISIIAYDPTSANDDVEGTYVKDLTIDGLSTSNSGTGVEVVSYDNTTGVGGTTRGSGIERVKLKRLANGIDFEGTQGFIVRGVKFYQNTNGVYCIVNDENTNATSQQVTFDNCDFRDNVYGVYETYNSGSKAYGWLFQQCHFEINEYGVVADNIIRWTFINTKFEQNDDYAIDFEMPEFILFQGCYFNNNSDVTLGPQIYIEPISSYTTPTSTPITFRICNFRTGSSSYDVTLSYARNIIFEQCYFEGGPTRINATNYSSYEIKDGHETELPDPLLMGRQKVISCWVTHADLAAPIYLGLMPRPTGSGSKYFYLDQILIDVTEAFDLGGGSYTVIQTGVNSSAQYFGQSQDVTATGEFEPTMNREGYVEPLLSYWMVTLTSDGTPTQGKALVVIKYFEVPKEP